ncbi:MAG: NADH-quinone oxidoreductase subunit K [Candidatus Hydrogenedentota bacterium]
MKSGFDTVMIFLVLSNLALLGSSRLGMCVRALALQGLVLSVLPVIVDMADITARDLTLGLGTMLVKGFLFPWILLRTLRDAGVRREIEPYVGYTMSLIIGAALLALALWLDRRLPLPHSFVSPLLVPVSFFTIFCGLFILLSRKKAITQVIGYLVLENGIYSFGMALAHEEPFLVEMGMLLDIFAAVFVMGIAIFHIHREFEHMDTARMTLLKDDYSG